MSSSLLHDASLTQHLAEPREGVAEWLVAFRRAGAELAPDLRATSLRACTALMADALREAGFYEACDGAEGGLA